MASSLSLISGPPDPAEKMPRPGSEHDRPDSPVPAEPATANATWTAGPSSPSNPSATASEPEDLFAVLRHSIADQSQPPDSVIRAVSEAARVLTAADGVAIAFRTKGVVLCRARCGELAPDLGSYVNANSGISGECLRTATILVCEDAHSDPRVDNLVCERMGIRSIVVVPLRGPVGISGILEVFSNRVHAFGNREINCLRGLAEMAETAYARERLAQQEATRAALRSAHRLPALLARAVGSDPGSHGAYGEMAGQPDDPRPERLWWTIGVATIALLLILGVWLSWHGPISELTELEAAETHTSPTQPIPQPRNDAAPAKPEPGILRTSDQKIGLRIAAARGPQLRATQSENTLPQAQPDAETANPGQIATAERNPSPNSLESIAQAPQVNISVAHDGGQLTSLISDRQPLPVMAAPVSRGVTQGELVHRVAPVYPVQARAAGISGSVVLEIRVAEDGTVGEIRTLSGDPQLATAALQAVRQWRYEPTLLDGHPIAIDRQVTVVFKLP